MFRLGAWLISPDDGSLSRPGASVRLEPQVMALLVYLCERAGKVVPKNDILDGVWKSRYVSDETLKSAFHHLRKALGDDPRHPRYIETIPKRGYRVLVEPSGLDREAFERARIIAGTAATPQSLAQARIYFERAVETEPQNARAHAGLSRTLTALAISGEGGKELLVQADAAAKAALELDPQCAEACAAGAMCAFLLQRDPAAAQALFRRALAIDSDSAPILGDFARFLSSMGRHAEAIERALAAFARDPLSVGAERSLLDVLYAAGRYDDALAQAQHLLERHPGATDVRLALTWMYYLKGERAHAYAALLRALEDLHVQDAVVTAVRGAYASEGVDAVLRLWLRMLEREAMLGRKVDRDLVTLNALLGQNGACLDLLERACADGAPWVMWIPATPLADGLRDDPRFHALLEALHLPQPFPNR